MTVFSNTRGRRAHRRSSAPPAERLRCRPDQGADATTAQDLIDVRSALIQQKRRAAQRALNNCRIDDFECNPPKGGCTSDDYCGANTPRACAGLFFVGIGERGGTRTLDPMIKSHVLYHLSYALTAALCRGRLGAGQ